MKNLSLREAAESGVLRLRLPQWASPFDHVEIMPCNGVLWIRAPFNEECNGREPMATLATQFNTTSKVWLLYDGKLPDSAEYLAERESYRGCLTKNL